MKILFNLIKFNKFPTHYIKNYKGFSLRVDTQSKNVVPSKELTNIVRRYSMTTIFLLIFKTVKLKNDCS